MTIYQLNIYDFSDNNEFHKHSIGESLYNYDNFGDKLNDVKIINYCSFDKIPPADKESTLMIFKSKHQK